jgi:hypothetical protein
MAGTIQLSEDIVWMPAGWVYDGVLDLIAAELATQDASLASTLLASRTTDGGFCDLRQFDPSRLRLLVSAAERAYERLEAEGPGSFNDPSFYPGFVNQFGQLNSILRAHLSSMHH